MLREMITGPRAWRADTIDERERWYLPLTQSFGKALASTVAELRRRPRPLTELQALGTPCSACRDELGPARDALERGRGFVILRGLPDGPYATEELKCMYWLIGQLLGQPFAQNVQGTLLYDVADYGQDVRQGARFSVTNAESSFHTDNSFGAEVCDYVGLLCVQPAQTGGLSQLVSGYSVHNSLLTENPDALALLYESFHVDRRGGVRPGESPTIQAPVIAWDGRELLFRYFRSWIEAGHDKVGQPLLPAQRAALEALDCAAAAPELRVEFALERGDLFFINNRWLLHNRTAFTDFPDLARRRHLVRLWLH
jgi:alpha-ketoglutarate-dependent taurine dioxygenase